MFSRTEPRALETIEEVPYITTRLDAGPAKPARESVAPVARTASVALPCAVLPGVACTTVLVVLAALLCFWAAEPVTSTQYAAFLLLALALTCHIASVWASETRPERGGRELV